MNKLVALLLGAGIFVTCQVKPQEINFGQDACHFCKMTIVDRQHAAEIVTVKGKAFKYDAIECMMNHLAKWDQPEVAYYLVSDYTKPGTLVSAEDAYYLVSEAIPSPMGEFLTAFSTEDARDSAVDQAQGELLNWKQLLSEFDVSTLTINK